MKLFDTFKHDTDVSKERKRVKEKLWEHYVNGNTLNEDGPNAKLAKPDEESSPEEDSDELPVITALTDSWTLFFELPGLRVYGKNLDADEGFNSTVLACEILTEGHVGAHSHPQAETFYVIHGTLHVTVGGRTFEVTEDSAPITIPPHVKHSTRWDAPIFLVMKMEPPLENYE